MRNIFLIIFLIFLACSSDKPPKDILTKEKMVKLMTEIHILEAKIHTMHINPSDSTQEVYAHYEKLLFIDLKIKRNQYEHSMNYYMDNPKEFEKIYEAVVDTLLLREGRYK